MNSEEKIRKIAYDLYVKNGRREGEDLLHWLAAEQIVRFEQRIFAKQNGDGVGLLEYHPQSTHALPMPQARSKTRPRNGSVGRQREAGGRNR